MAVVLAVSILGCANATSGSKTAESTVVSTSVADVAGAALGDPADAGAPVAGHVEVIASHRHDPKAFTQGLVIGADRTMWESTGRYGHSTLRIVDIGSGEVIREAKMADDIFAEGLALVGDRLIQLTWKEGVAIIYDATTLEEVGRFEYDGEGWGLCYDGHDLVMSDGSDRLMFRDPDTFEVIASVGVTEAGAPARMLNELECANGRVYANQWKTDRILEIDPTTGVVTAVIDASGLLDDEQAARADVLNGIAHDPATGTFFITGKHWPTMFEVVFRADEAR